MPENHFGAEVAAHYDRTTAERFDPRVLDPTVDLLAELAGRGRVLELGVGTGRIALPLAARGIDVAGIDLSPEMVGQLRAKPGGDAIDVTIGDFATTRVAGEFSLVVLVFNTINNLTTQDAQVACFANAAAHLAPGGRFVVEVGVPRLRRLPEGERFVAFAATEHHLGIDELDVVTQRLVSHHAWRVDGEWSHASIPFRYVWPSELDLMARLAEMDVEHRWADWDRSPFTAASREHVSVWVRRH